MSHFHRPLKAKQTEYNGRVYASKMEAKRAMELDVFQRVFEVAWWIPQVQIQLGPDDKYRVDFLVAERCRDVLGAVLVYAEDVKGIETREFARHKRLWRKYGPMPLRVITRKGTEIVEREQ